MPSVTSRVPRPISRAKLWSFRLLAICLGLLPLVAAEGLLRTTSWGLPDEAVDPYVGFDAVRPLFELDPAAQQYATDPARLAFFRPESFAAEKPQDEFRIFCLGGSTVQGRPYAIETSFTTWLELSLQAADPRHQWQVVNIGGVSYASYRLAPILDELLQYEPDLFIVYTGHNEFLEDRTYRDIKSDPPWLRLLRARLTRLRTYNVARSAWRDYVVKPPQPAAPPNRLADEVSAILDFTGGLADYHRDDDWYRGGAEHYRFNLERMIERSRAAKIPIMLVNPGVNLRDCPPFKSAHRDDLSADDRVRFDRIWEAAKDAPLRERTRLLEQAVDIDPRMAAAQFALAKCYEAAGRHDEARTRYLHAKDEDICPLRMYETLYENLRVTVQQLNVPLVDARAFFASSSTSGIPGDNWFLDHVHPSINGHQEIAGLLMQKLVELRIVQPRDGWESARNAQYEEHLASLGDIYFMRGKQRLEGLLRWTKGMAEQEKGTAPNPVPIDFGISRPPNLWLLVCVRLVDFSPEVFAVSA